MVEITSREELEEWFQQRNHADFTQVIAARAALRKLIFAFQDEVFDFASGSYIISLFRAALISWVAPNVPAIDIFSAASAAARIARKSKYSFTSVEDAVHAAAEAAMLRYGTADSVTLATRSAYANYAIADSAYVAAYLVSRTGDLYVACDAFEWIQINFDSIWLEHQAKQTLSSRFLTRTKLWPLRYPEGWDEIWQSATTRLLTLDLTYQVWIDWYNRRIEGHDAAFDIPGDVDRTYDKAILARLADATDKDFWGKGATYVNTTLQRWIDEARIDARIDAVAAKLHGGATAHYGAPEEMAGRTALLDELDRLLGKSWQARLGIGGNNPPEPIDLSVRPVALPDEMREPLEAISTELEKREPDALVVVEKVKLLHRVVRKLEKMADIASDEFAKSVGGELGKLVVKGVFWLAVINQILDWLTRLIRISG